MEHCLGQLEIVHDNPCQPLYTGPEHLAVSSVTPAALCAFILLRVEHTSLVESVSSRLVGNVMFSVSVIEASQDVKLIKELIN